MGEKCKPGEICIGGLLDGEQAVAAWDAHIKPPYSHNEATRKFIDYCGVPDYAKDRLGVYDDLVFRTKPHYRDNKCTVDDGLDVKTSGAGYAIFCMGCDESILWGTAKVRVGKRLRPGDDVSGGFAEIVDLNDRSGFGRGYDPYDLRIVANVFCELNSVGIRDDDEYYEHILNDAYVAIHKVAYDHVWGPFPCDASVDVGGGIDWMWDPDGMNMTCHGCGDILMVL